MKATKKLIMVAILAAVLPGTASAATSVNEGYLVDSAGRIVKNGSGGCWHTGYWMPGMAVEGCDPVAVVVAAKEEIKPSPKVIAIQPPPLQIVPEQTKIFAQKIVFCEEGHFDFNEAKLRPKDKEKLDNLVRELESTKY